MIEKTGPQIAIQSQYDLSLPPQEQTLKNSFQTDGVFRFSESELDKIKIMMPKYYSLMSKRIMQKLKQGLKLTPKEKKIIGTFNYQDKKVNSLEQLILEQKNLSFPSIENQNAIDEKTIQLPQMTSDEVTKINNIEDKESQKQEYQEKLQNPENMKKSEKSEKQEEQKNQEKQKKQEKSEKKVRQKIEPQIRKKPPPLTPQESLALMNKKRDQQVAKLIVTKVYPPGPLPKINIRKYIEQQVKKREKKRQEKQKMLQKKEEMRKKLDELQRQKRQRQILMRQSAPKTEKESIERLISEFINHPKYAYLLQARTRPSIIFLERLMEAKKRKKYTLNNFQIDVQRIFQIYRNTSGSAAAILKETEKFEKEFLKKIEETKEILNIKNQIPAKSQVKSKEQSSLEGPKILNSSSRGRIRKNLFMQFDTSKKGRKRKVSGEVKKSPDIRDRKVIGKNLLSLPKKHLQEFILKFCSSCQQTNVGRASIFQFDLNSISSQRLYEIQQFIKKVFEIDSRPYKDLSEEEVSEDLMISEDQN